MYASRLDRESAVMIGIYSGASVSDAAYERQIEDLRQVDGCGSDSKTTAFICVPDPGTPTPPASWRSRFSKATGEMKNPHVFVLITQSIVTRGVMTAIAWVVDKSRYTTRACATLEEAARYLEKTLGRPLPRLPQLYAEARAEIEAASEVGARPEQP